MRSALTLMMATYMAVAVAVAVVLIPILVLVVMLVAAAVEVKALTGQATSMAARAVLVVYRLAYHHPVPALMVALQRPVLAVRVAA